MEYTYFAQSQGSERLIKIGRSLQLEKRLRGVVTEVSGAIQLVGVVDFWMFGERALHEQFKVHRHHGEWFHPHQDILDFIQKNGLEHKLLGRIFGTRPPPKDRRARRLEQLTAKLSHPKESVRERAASTLMYEFREVAIPIYEAHRAQADKRLNWWFDELIVLIHKYPSGK